MPNYPAEIRAPAGTIAGVSSFQVHISDHDIVTPGDVPNVLVAMNPAALKANLAELPPGATHPRQLGRVRRPQPHKVGYDANPLDDGSLAAYRVVQVPMTSAHARGVQGARGQAARRRAVEELLRPRPDLVDVHPADRARRSSGSTQKFASRRAGARRQPRRVQGRATLRRDRRAVRPPYEIAAGAARPGPLPQHHRQPRGRLRPHRRRAAGEPADPVRVVPDHPGVRHPPRAVEAQELRRAHAAGRGRDRGRRGRRSAPRSPASSASPRPAARAST